MEKEAASTKLQNSVKSSISKGYHSFADYISKSYMEQKEKGNTKTMKMAVAKYVLVFLNIFYMLISLLMINAGTIGLIFRYYLMAWSGQQMLSIYWVTTGAILLFASIFGLIGAFKENVIWTNIYGVIMTIVFLLQIGSAIATFSLIGKSRSIAWNGINSLMSDYDYPYYNSKNHLDFIQKNFHCCGNDLPSDWNSFSKFRLNSVRGNNNYYYETTTTTVAPPLHDLMPASCCTEESNYTNLTCNEYYVNGCVNSLREVIAESIMIIGSVALTIAVLQILGIVLAFVVAKVMRKTKSYFALRTYNELGCSHLNDDDITTLKTTELIREDVSNI